MKLIQVAVGASAKQVTSQVLYASTIIAYASAANSFLGDDTVTTSNGVVLPTTTSLVITTSVLRGIPLNSLYVIGTSGNVNILYEPAQ